MSARSLQVTGTDLLPPEAGLLSCTAAPGAPRCRGGAKPRGTVRYRKTPSRTHVRGFQETVRSPDGGAGLQAPSCPRDTRPWGTIPEQRGPPSTRGSRSLREMARPTAVRTGPRRRHCAALSDRSSVPQEMETIAALPPTFRVLDPSPWFLLNFPREC